jgi:hypothetical protein
VPNLPAQIGRLSAQITADSAQIDQILRWPSKVGLICAETTSICAEGVPICAPGTTGRRRQVPL